MAIVLAAIALPLLNLIASAPDHVTDADIADLQSQARPGDADRAVGLRRGMSTCDRDKGALGLAEALRLPHAVVLRIEYVQITDCLRRVE